MSNTEDTALNQNVGEETNVSTTPVEEIKAPETETEPIEEASSTDEAETKGEDTEKEVPVRKGAEARIRELNAKAKAEKERADSLAQKLENFTREVVPQGPQAPYQSQVEPGTEVTPEQYKSDVMRTADALVQLRLNQQKVVDNINSEANKAIKEYPELDPDSDQFNKELNDTVTEATLALVRSNPTASVKKFVDRLMKPYKKSLTKEVAEETETITKQVAAQSLRPTPMVKSNKNDREKTIEELERELGVVY
jgi:hypothetical protein